MKKEPEKALKSLIRDVFDLSEPGGGDIENIIYYNDAKDAVNIAFQEGQSSPKIKQLEWVLESGGWHISMTQFGVSYEIGESKNDGNFILYDILLTTTIHDTIDEAKAAAQADFEKRVMECLDL